MKTPKQQKMEAWLVNELKRIRRKYKNYSKSKPVYLNICLNDNYTFFNNAYWDNDRDMPINICYSEDTHD